MAKQESLRYNKAITVKFDKRKIPTYYPTPIQFKAPEWQNKKA